MAQDEMLRLERIVHDLMPIAEAIILAGCFCWLIKPFMRKKEGVICGGAAYFLTIRLLYITRLSRDAYVIFGTGTLVMFFVICWMDKRNYRQKIFLAVTFFALTWFAGAMAEILYDNLYDFFLRTDYMQRHPDLSSFLYLIMCVCDLLFELAFTAAGVWQVLKVYANKSAEMEKKEVVMLILPSVMGLTGYEIMRYYRLFYALEIGTMEKAYDGLTVLFCAASMVTVIVVIVLYQDIKAKQEENLQTRLLATQIDSIRQHVEQVESLYQDIRSVKHDMTNHILTLERLYEGNQTEEARAYSDDLKAELAKMTGEIKSGNPVTDVILQESKEEAEKKGVSFCSEFYYPADSKINAFDISVILNNALQNAIENTEKDGHISIVSYRRNNAYMIEISNSFAGSLQWDAGSRLLSTSKERAEGHGYGLTNVRRVARKYAGDTDITVKDGEFRLCVMLMVE